MSPQPDDSILIRIDENVKHLRNEAIPELKNWQQTHGKLDDERFGQINSKLDRADGAMRALKWVGGILGAVVLALIAAFFEHVMGGK